MNRLFTFLVLLALPLGAIAQWNTDVSVNLQIAPDGGNIYNLYGNDGYFFCYDENVIYKIHRYNVDGTPNWATAMLPNNRPVGSATFKKYAFLDNASNLIHISSFDNNGSIHYCINKIDTNGNQLWNGSSGIEIDAFVIGAYLSPNNDLYVAKENKTLQKYSASGVLEWTSSFADATISSVSNVSIVEKADGSIGVVFFKPGNNFVYGQYYYSGMNSNGVLLNTVQIEDEYCRFFSDYKLLSDNNDIYFLFTDQTDKAHVQKITSNEPLYPVNGLDMDISTTHASIYQSAIITNDKLYILYHYYEVVNGNIGIMSQTIDLASFSRNFPNGNVLFDCNSNNVFTLENGMIKHNDKFGFLVLDNTTKKMTYNVFDGNAIEMTHDVCTTSSEKQLAALSTLNNINTSNSQVAVLFLDDRDNNFSFELYAQNILFDYVLGADNQIAIDKQVEVYPNPANSTLFIKSDQSIKDIEIYNTIGQLVAKISNTNEIEASNWQVGAYFLKITTKNNQIFVKNIIKK